MEHKFPLGSLHQENRTTFLEILFIPENFQWNKPKSRAPLHPNRNFRNYLVNAKRSVSSKHSYRPMRVHVVVQLFYNR